MQICQSLGCRVAKLIAAVRGYVCHRTCRRWRFLGMIAISCAVSAQDFSYRQSSKPIYDEARLISPAKFRDDVLKQIFESFVSAECATRKLARLTLATSQHDLGDTTNAISPHSIPSAQIIRIQTGGLSVAQALCFEGKATSFIRHGRIVTRTQISGTTASRDVFLEGTKLTLVGFRLRSQPPGQSEDPRPLPDRVWIYAQAAVLPNIPVAARIHQELQELTGVPTYLIVRTDPFFSDYDGPITDLFDTSSKQYSRDSYTSRPTVVCRPTASGNKCEQRKQSD
jgi:hypothetical protein